MPTPDDFDIEEVAAADFGKPAGPELLRQFEAEAWHRECTEAGVDLRLAAIILEKTKDDLIEVARRLGQDSFQEELERLVDRQKRFADLAMLLQSAASRLIVAGAAVVAEGRATRRP